MLSDTGIEAIKEFLAKNNLKTNSFELVQTAFTHPSYTNYNGLDYSQNYERLEFLGDAVLKLITSKYLFAKYTTLHEGELTKIRSSLVSDLCLAKFAKQINLDTLLLFGKVDFNTKTNVPESVLACAFEALLGALYLSSDFVSIENFLIPFFDLIVEEIKDNSLYINAKAILQEYTQSIDKSLPIYEIKSESGPEHNKTFEVDVIYQDKVLATAFGKNKKEAQQNAAAKACEILGLIKNDNI